MSARAKTKRKKKSRGALFVIGGREARREDIPVLERFMQDCGGQKAEMVFISTASRDPGEMEAKYRAAFGSLGASNLHFYHQDNREDADNPDFLAAIEHADGVFFTGGNQLKLVTALAGTEFMAKLQSRHNDGLILGGTSAGASAMSAVMIARGTGRTAARMSSVRMSPGFGFLPQIIVDQHFRERDRFGRLLAAVLSNPSMLGFGLDENTAFILDASDCITVIGSGTLTIVDGSELYASNVHAVVEELPAAFAGMRMHSLSDGWAFDIASRRVTRPPVPPPVNSDQLA